MYIACSAILGIHSLSQSDKPSEMYSSIISLFTKSLEKEKVPSLSQIAADIQGTKPMAPRGDSDQYGGRATARLEGWVSGLSFGAKRRAKKFSK